MFPSASPLCSSGTSRNGLPCGLQLSILEVYNERIRDLLDVESRHLDLRMVKRSSLPPLLSVVVVSRRTAAVFRRRMVTRSSRDCQGGSSVAWTTCAVTLPRHKLQGPKVCAAVIRLLGKSGCSIASLLPFSRTPNSFLRFSLASRASSGTQHQ